MSRRGTRASATVLSPNRIERVSSSTSAVSRVSSDELRINSSSSSRVRDTPNSSRGSTPNQRTTTLAVPFRARTTGRATVP